MALPTSYQRVTTATNYDASAGLPYLKFDGVDDSLSTNSISFTSTDKMSVFAGVRKLSDAAGVGILTELGANGFQDGNFAFFCSDAGGTYSFVVENSFYRPSGYPAPITNVLSCVYDLAQTSISTEIIPRINGVLAQSNPTGTGTGTGNFANSPLYIGRRNNASLPFNGQMYSMIIVGKAVTAGELSSTETFVANKTGVTL